MNPMFFGSTERSLFGIYHPPRTQQTRPQGVVLCYPIGQEYMRAHRAFRQLAILLSRQGYPVLRFDYYGTGDSGGDTTTASLEAWTDDVETAVVELKDNAAVDSVVLIGLRVGSWLAADAQNRRGDVSQVVLWDPVSEGAGYLRELLASTELSKSQREVALDDTRHIVGINGFAWTPALRRQVQQLAATSYTPSDRTVGMLVSEERADYATLRDRYASAGARFTYRCVPSPGDWAYIDAYGSALLPQDIIQSIVGHLTEESDS